MTPTITDAQQMPYRFHYNGDVHVALCLMRSAKKPITVRNMAAISARFADRRTDFLAKAVSSGYVIQDGLTYAITPLGVDALYAAAAFEARKRIRHGRKREDED